MSDRVDITLPDGTAATVPQADLAQAIAAGATARATTATSNGDDGGLLGSIAAGILGAGSSATLGATDKLAREISYIIGGPEASREVTSQLRLVRERNPYSTMAGELGGLLLNPEALSGPGELAAAPVAARVGEGLLGKAATSAARLGIETALMGAQHEITEESLGDHDLNAQAIWSQAAKEGMLGAVGGGVLGLAGGLLGKAGGATRDLLARRSGPIADRTLDEIAGVEGAGSGVRSQASRAEKTIADLRATGMTSDQAVDMVNDLENAAKVGGSSADKLADGPFDKVAEEVIAGHAGNNPERAEIMRRHYLDTLKPIEAGTSAVDRTALDMSKAGTSMLRNVDDVANEAQFVMRSERFAKLVDPAKLDLQLDQVNSFLQDADAMLTFWETTEAKGGAPGAIKALRRSLSDVQDTVATFSERGDANLGRELNIRMNRLKRNMDRYVPYGRAPGIITEGGGRAMFGVPEAIMGPSVEGMRASNVSELADLMRAGLEDEAVWGEAGAAQARENASFSEMKARFDDFKGTYGVNIDQSQGVRIPEIDYSSVRSVLDKITGNPEIDEALQPIKSARRTIEGMRGRIAALRESGELTEAQVSKLSQGEKDVAAFEKSLNGAMKEAAIANRVKAAVLEEGHSGMGGLLGAGLDTVNRPMATMRRLAQIRHTAEKVRDGAKAAFREVFDVGGSSTEGVAARAVEPRPKEKIIEEMQAIRAMAGNPAALEQAASRIVGDLSKYAPKTADAIRLTALRALIYLATEAPVASVSTTGTLGTPKARYSDVQLHDWETKRNAAFNPADVIQDMKHGRLNRDAIQSAKAVAPQMFAEMQNLAREQIGAMAARGELDNMPYQQKAVIASLLEVPADRTFEPDFMAMLQAAKVPPAKPQGGGGRGGGGPSKPPAYLQTEAQRIEGGL